MSKDRSKQDKIESKSIQENYDITHFGQKK